MATMYPATDKRIYYEIASGSVARVADARLEHLIRNRRMVISGSFVLDPQDAAGCGVGICIGAEIRYTSWRVRRSRIGDYWIAGSMSAAGVTRLEIMRLRFWADDQSRATATTTLNLNAAWWEHLLQLAPGSTNHGPGDSV